MPQGASAITAAPESLATVTGFTVTGFGTKTAEEAEAYLARQSDLIVANRSSLAPHNTQSPPNAALGARPHPNP